MNLKSIPKAELLARTNRLVENERRITTEVLWHLFEIERRRLFAEIGFSSLFEYCTRELKYSGSSAYRRISAMRLLKSLPEIESKITSGELSVTTASQLQSFFIAAGRQENKVFSPVEKRELLEKVEGKSTRECQKIFTHIAPKALPPETKRVLTPNQTEIRFVADDELLALFKQVQDMAAHQLGGASDYASLFKVMANAALTKLESTHKSKSTSKSKAPLTAPEVHCGTGTECGNNADRDTKSDRGTKTDRGVKSDRGNKTVRAIQAGHAINLVFGNGKFSRYLQKKIKEQVWTRDQGQCSYVDPGSKRRCAAKYALEFDHRIPFALGGVSTVENLRILCRTHNQFYAARSFGEAKLARHAV